MAEAGLEPRNLTPKPSVLLPAAAAISEQREEMQCFCSVETLQMGGPSSPSFRTMTWAVQSWSSSLLDMPMILDQDPWPALSGSSFPEATGQISVASCRAACMERRVDISIWNAEDRLAFVLHQTLCQQNSPKRSEELWEPLGHSSWGIPPQPQPHTPCTSELTPPLKAPHVASFPVILLGSSANRLTWEPGSGPCSSIGREVPFLTSRLLQGREALPALLTPTSPRVVQGVLLGPLPFATIVSLLERIRAQAALQHNSHMVEIGFSKSGQSLKYKTRVSQL